MKFAAFLKCQHHILCWSCKQKQEVTWFSQQLQFDNKKIEKWTKYGQLMLRIYNLSDLLFFFLGDCNIWHCFLDFVIALYSTAIFVVDECFNCTTSLNKWFLPFGHTVINMGHDITDPAAVGKPGK